MTATGTPFDCIQLFNRRAMGSLWERRKELDPGQVKILKCLYDSKKRGTLDCKTPVTYALSRSKAGQMGYGRYYGTAGSLETLERDIRATLCSEFYTDVDIVNCHPVLLVQMADKWLGKKMPILASYAANRQTLFYDKYADRFTEEHIKKNLMMPALYNGKLDEDVPEEFHAIANEVALLRVALKKAEAHKDLWAYCDKIGIALPGVLDTRTNPNGSFLALIVQTEERKCAEVIMDYFRKQKLSVDVYSYDGCQVRGVGVVTDEMLRECEEAVKETTGWSIQLKVKPFDEPLETIPTTEDALETAYADMKAEWEKDHFYFKPTNTIVEVAKSGTLSHYALDHATEAFNGWKLGADEKGEPTPFLKKWRADDKRRMIDTLVYKKPEDCKPNEATLFFGFKYQTLEPCENEEAVGGFQGLVRAVCNDHEPTYTYLLCWFAHLIQKPFEKMGVCPILINKTQGTGKDTICLWMKKILGNHVAHYNDEEQFWEKFDTQKEGAVMMYLEEVGSGASKKKSSELKARLTSDILKIRPIGLKAYDVPNIGNYIMTTNVTDPVRIEGTDRRFFPIYGSSRLRVVNEETRAFWEHFYTESRIGDTEANPTWLYPVGKFLESIDLTDFKPRDMPETEYKNEVVEMSQASEEAFIKQWVGEDVPMNELYIAYKDWCMENSMAFAPTSASFGKNLMGYASYVVKKRTGKGMVYSKLV